MKLSTLINKLHAAQGIAKAQGVDPDVAITCWPTTGWLNEVSDVGIAKTDPPTICINLDETTITDEEHEIVIP